MSNYTEESVRRAMMEQVCQGLEGHHPLNFKKAMRSPHMFYVSFQCSKCKLFVHVRDIDLKLEDSDEQLDPRSTPPYYGGRGC